MLGVGGEFVRNASEAVGLPAVQAHAFVDALARVTPVGVVEVGPIALPANGPRPRVQGKFFYVGDQRFLIRGVTYGPFSSRSGLDDDGDASTPPSEYHTPDVVRADFRLMAASGINTVRLYTVPPTWLLDIAAENGLRLIIGIPWEQHVAFLDTWKIARRIVQKVREAVISCSKHRAVLALLVGNEIPAPIVRWYGPRSIEQFIQRLYRAAKLADPDCIISYANYPTTEYLNLPFLDFVAFNVYLESPDLLRAYVVRLQNVCGDRPLLMSELGLDSKRHGTDAQATALDWQIATCLSDGCAGRSYFHGPTSGHAAARRSANGVSV